MESLQTINQLLHWQPNSDLSALPVVDETEHRVGMRHFAAAVSIVTTQCNGEFSGLTATAVCSVTAEPPRLVVFVNKNTYAASQIIESGLLCVNTLSNTQTELACIFAGMRKEISSASRFEHGDWKSLVTGAPVLSYAKASFDCRVIKIFDESTHYAFLGEVLATRSNAESGALLYMGGGFCTVTELDE